MRRILGPNHYVAKRGLRTARHHVADLFGALLGWRSDQQGTIFPNGRQDISRSDYFRSGRGSFAAVPVFVDR